MKLKFNYVKNKHQKEFDSDLTTKFLGLVAGYGSGKSYALVMKALKLSWLNRPTRGGIVAPSIPEYKKDVLPIFEQIIEENKFTGLFHYHKTDKVWKTPWKGLIEVATAENRIRGPNWAWACINEATLISKERFLEVIGRVRVKRSRYPQIAFSGTPEGKAHHVYEMFVDKPMENSRLIQGDTRDNAMNLSEDYIRTLESAYDPLMLQAYMMGLFVNMKGNQFYYSYDPMRNLDRSITPILGLGYCVTLDFNVDPMCATVWQIVPYNGRRRLQGIDQVQLRHNSMGNYESLTAAMAEALKQRGYTPDITTIYPDPAGRARSTSGNPDIVILRNSGFDKIKYKNAAPQFRSRQLCTNNLLARGDVVVNPDKCPGMKRDWEAVEQDQGDFSKIKKNPELTHHSDGFDYLCDIEFPLSGKKPNSGMQRIR